MNAFDPARRAVLERRYLLLQHANLLAILLAAAVYLYGFWLIDSPPNWKIRGWMLVPVGAGAVAILVNYASAPGWRRFSRLLGGGVAGLTAAALAGFHLVELLLAPRTSGLAAAAWILAGLLELTLVGAAGICQQIDDEIAPFRGSPVSPPPPPDDLDGRDLQKWDEAS